MKVHGRTATLRRLGPTRMFVRYRTCTRSSAWVLQPHGVVETGCRGVRVNSAWCSVPPPSFAVGRVVMHGRGATHSLDPAPRALL